MFRAPAQLGVTKYQGWDDQILKGVDGEAARELAPPTQTHRPAWTLSGVSSTP
jgi:hypothetical protein